MQVGTSCLSSARRHRTGAAPEGEAQAVSSGRVVSQDSGHVTTVKVKVLQGIGNTHHVT